MATTANKSQSTPGIVLGPMDPKLDREMQEKLITARVGLLLKASFFGNLATRLRLVNADEWCLTAATDGRNFYYNSRFIQKLRPKEVEFLFGHEVLHVVYDHMGRVGYRNHQLYNQACDYAVNADLLEQKVGERITTVDILYDAKYKGLTSEEIYDLLLDQKQQKKKQGGKGGGDGDDEGSGTLDEHLDGNHPANSKGNKDGKGGPAVYTDAEKQAIRDEITEAVLSAAQAAGAGNLPAGVRRMIQDLTEPKMNWRELLRMQLESTIKNDYTWLRASRRGWHMDAVMPGMRNDPMIDIAVAIDTSGSIGAAMLRDFLSEIQGIMDSFPAYRIHVFSFDTSVHNPAQYNSDNLESIAEYEPGGGGGTDFTAIYDYLKAEDIEPKRLVVFTDGYPYGSWGDANYTDTVWILHGTTTIEPPFGTWAYYTENT
jgi:predicted metal-dependent peptidase